MEWQGKKQNVVAWSSEKAMAQSMLNYFGWRSSYKTWRSSSMRLLYTSLKSTSCDPELDDQMKHTDIDNWNR